MEPSDVDTVIGSLGRPDFVVAYLNDDAVPYHFHRSTFDSRTGDLYHRVKNLHEMSDGTHISIVLEGDSHALKILLFWLAKGRVPGDDYYNNHDNYLFDHTDMIGELLINCWLVGDKYKIRDFQDA